MEDGSARPPAATLVGTILIASGIGMIALGAILAVAVDARLAAIAFVGVIDIPLGIAWRRGRISGVSAPATGDGELSTRLEDDPTHNPYARED